MNDVQNDIAAVFLCLVVWKKSHLKVLSGFQETTRYYSTAPSGGGGRGGILLPRGPTTFSRGPIKAKIVTFYIFLHFCKTKTFYHICKTRWPKPEEKIKIERGRSSGALRMVCPPLKMSGCAPVSQ